LLHFVIAGSIKLIIAMEAGDYERACERLLLRRLRRRRRRQQLLLQQNDE
jgi:hypothetical protein